MVVVQVLRGYGRLALIGLLVSVHYGSRHHRHSRIERLAASAATEIIVAIVFRLGECSSQGAREGGAVEGHLFCLGWSWWRG